MESLLTPLQSKSKPEVKEYLLEVNTPQPQCSERGKLSITSPEDALEALRSKPDLELLAKILRWLTTDSHKDHVFIVKRPSPKAALILFVLVNDIVPDYWQLLNAEGASGYPKEKRMLITCLRSVAGIGVITSLLRRLVTEFKDSRSQTKIPSTVRTQPMYDLLEIIEVILHGEDSIAAIWRDIDACIKASTQKSLQWKELLSLLASGKLLSIASEASLVLNDTNSTIKTISWVGDGNRYSAWLGRNIQSMNEELPTNDIEGRKALSQLFSKALNLGYKGPHVIRMIMRKCLLLRGRSGCQGRILKFAEWR